MKRIAIIGAGIAGLSTAYYLSKLARQGGQQLEIMLLEKEKRLGQEAGLNRQEEDRKAAREKTGQEESIEKEGKAHAKGGQTVSRRSFASIEG